MLDKIFKDNCINNGNLSRKEILYGLNLHLQEDMEELKEISNNIREKYCGSDVQIRALLEISNICARNCNYCGVRQSNSKIHRYKMTPEEIINTAINLHKMGFKTIVMQSGESKAYVNKEIAFIIEKIKSLTKIAITLSLGEHSFDTYKMWKEAGADRYLLRHETANEKLYSYLHPDGTLQNRIKCLYDLKELGYQVGAGCMVGSPTQSYEEMADDLEFIRDFKPDMIGIGPFISHEDTPFKEFKVGTLEDTLKMIALARIISRDALLPSTTALASISQNGQKQGLETACDVVMVNFTPLKYKLLYEIYPNKKCMTEDINSIINNTKNMIFSINRTISTDYGHSKKLKNKYLC